MKVRTFALLPKGFEASGCACGLKKSGKPDLALIVSRTPCAAAHLSTANTLPAAPVKLNRLRMAAGVPVHAIVANSGNANAFTGAQGVKDAYAMARAAAQELDIAPERVLVASTGVINRRLAVKKIVAAMPALVRTLDARGIARAQAAIMTTDKFPKWCTAAFGAGGRTVTVCGIAKGAGMIAPDMATMLCFIMTDAAVGKAVLQRCLRQAVAQTFNRITVDGCMSTNDTVIALANGCAGNPAITGGTAEKALTQALTRVCDVLAKMMVRDGEGCGRMLELTVRGAASAQEARTVALQIANSNLVKTALSAGSMNIVGRIVAAIGATAVPVEEKRIKIAVRALRTKAATAEVSLGRGAAAWTLYTSDLTHEYVKINAEYN